MAVMEEGYFTKDGELVCLIQGAGGGVCSYTTKLFKFATKENVIGLHSPGLIESLEKEGLKFNYI